MGVSDFITTFFASKDNSGYSDVIQDADLQFSVLSPRKAKHCPSSVHSIKTNHVGEFDHQNYSSSTQKYSVSIGDQHKRTAKRSAPRKSIPELQIHVKRLNKQFRTTDISMSGVGFAFSTPRIKRGVDIRIDLNFGDSLYISNLSCRVVRHENGVVGCSFTTMKENQSNEIQRIMNHAQR